PSSQALGRAHARAEVAQLDAQRAERTRGREAPPRIVEALARRHPKRTQRHPGPPLAPEAHELALPSLQRHDGALRGQRRTAPRPEREREARSVVRLDPGFALAE